MADQVTVSQAPLRTPLASSNGTVTTAWAQFFNKLFLAAGAAIQATQKPVASTTASDLCVPIELNGVTYYLKLSSTP